MREAESLFEIRYDREAGTDSFDQQIICGIELVVGILARVSASVIPSRVPDGFYSDMCHVSRLCACFALGNLYLHRKRLAPLGA